MDLVYHAAVILKNDGKEDVYRFLNETDAVKGKTGVELLEKGTKDADIPFSGGYIFHMWHFHHPWSHRGYLSCRSSADYTAGLFARALRLWRAGNRGEALYQLGRSLHLLQDIFVPHHAGITAFRGHGALEDYLLKNWEAYLVTDKGYYEWETWFYHKAKGKRHHVSSRKPYDWIDHGSHISIDWYNEYFSGWCHDPEVFTRVTPLIIPRVLRFCAGFIYRFFNEAGL